MPRPYSDDLRRRALQACDEGEQPGRVAQRFRIGRASVYSWLKQRREEGRCRPKTMGGGPQPVIRETLEAALKRLVESDNDRTLAQYRDKLADETGTRVHPWTVGRALRRLRLTRKKKTLRAAEQDEAAVAKARQDWRTELEAIDPKRLVFLDESAALTNMSRTHARSPRGTRAYGAVPCGHGTRLTVLGALGTEGIIAAMSIEAATDGAVFQAFLDHVLLPALRQVKPEAGLVMDNLSAHKARAVRERLDRSEFSYRYLPSYSPDLNPIEPAWAKVKGRLRAVAARTAEALHAALGPALDAITPQDAQGFFRHAGYENV